MFTLYMLLQLVVEAMAEVDPMAVVAMVVTLAVAVAQVQYALDLFLLTQLQ
jgi:hypothetical protein